MFTFQPYVTGARFHMSLGIHVPFGPTYYSELRGQDYDWRGNPQAMLPVIQAWMHGSCLLSKEGG